MLIDPRTAANPGAGDESEERIADLETISRICASQNLPKDFFSVNHVFGVEYLIFSAPGLSVYLSAKNNVSTGTGPLSITSVVSNGELKNPTVSAAVSEVITANFTDFEKFCPNFSSLALSISEGGLSISVTQDFANKKFIVSVTAMIFEVETDSTDFPATAKLSVTLKYVFDMDSQTSPPNYATAKDWFSAIDWEQAREAVAIAAVCILVAIAFGYASIPIITMIMQAFPA